MFEKKKRILALILAVLFCFASSPKPILAEQALPTPTGSKTINDISNESGSNASFVLPEEDAVLAKVNGTVIFGYDVNRLFHNLTNEYAMYGFDFSDPELLNDLLIMAFNSVIQKTLLLQNASSVNIVEPSAEEIETLKNDVTKRYKEAYDALISELTANAANDSEKQQIIEKADNDLLVSKFTLDDVIARELETLTITKVQDAIVKDIVVDETEINDLYAQNVESDKLTFADDIIPYEESVANGTPVWYTPSGYRGIKHILLKVDEELLNKYNELKAIYEEQSSIHADGSESDVESKSEAVTEDQINEAQEAILSSVSDKISEINQKIEAKVSFDDLVNEYGNDPGMTRDPYKTKGYPVHENSVIYDPVFTDTAFTLRNLGDISQPVIGSYGVHILLYDNDIAEGPVQLTQENRSILEASALNNKKQQALHSFLEKWKNESTIEYIDSRFQPEEE